MELDDMKLAWQTLDRRLDLQNSLNLAIFKENRLDKARSSLRPLYWAQFLKILFGDAMILFGILSSMHYRDVPHLLVGGLCILLYGVLIVVFGGVILGKISRVDYAAPVLNIQKQLGSLRRIYNVTNLCAGLPWWLLWIPIFVLEVNARLGVDLFVTAPSFIWISAAVGIAGLIATWWYYRGSRSRQRPVSAKAMDDTTTARSVRKASAILDEVARFEEL